VPISCVRKGDFIEAERIRKALNHSHLEFHKPGYDIEHKSSCIMSSSCDAVQSTLLHCPDVHRVVMFHHSLAAIIF
jgi:hypothetical protein